MAICTKGRSLAACCHGMLRVPLVFDFQGSLTAEMVDHNFLDETAVSIAGYIGWKRFICNRLPHAILTSSVRARQLLQNEFQVPPDRIHPLPDCADTIGLIRQFLRQSKNWLCAAFGYS